MRPVHAATVSALCWNAAAGRSLDRPPLRKRIAKSGSPAKNPVPVRKISILLERDYTGRISLALSRRHSRGAERQKRRVTPRPVRSEPHRKQAVSRAIRNALQSRWRGARRKAGVDDRSRAKSVARSRNDLRLWLGSVCDVISLEQVWRFPRVESGQLLRRRPFPPEH